MRRHLSRFALKCANDSMVRKRRWMRGRFSTWVGRWALHMLCSDNGILFAVGMSKSGKTRLLKHELTEWLDDGGRAVVIDVLDDWPGDDMEWDGNIASANTMDAARKLVRTGWQCVIIKP